MYGKAVFLKVDDIAPLWVLRSFKEAAEGPKKIIAIVVFKMHNVW